MSDLYVVATPIGNLQDITQRALEVLGLVDLIVAEDTRHSGRLLAHYAIKKPLLSLHEHNEAERVDHILGVMREGKQVALISDAGTPLLSDPGYLLVRAAIAAQHRVIPIPGASAFLAAVMAAGLPNNRLFFLGFAPRRPAERRQWLLEAAEITATLVCYESPRRLPSLLHDVAEICGEDRRLAIARELTKKHETIWRGTAAEALQVFDQAPRGEIVLLIAPGEGKEHEGDQPALEALLKLVIPYGVPMKEFSKQLSLLTGVARKTIYQAALAYKDSNLEG